MRSVFDDTFVLLRCDYAYVLPILEYCSHILGSAADCHLLTEGIADSAADCHQVHSLAGLCPDQILALSDHRRRVAGLRTSHKVYYNSIITRSITTLSFMTMSIMVPPHRYAGVASSWSQLSLLIVMLVMLVAGHSCRCSSLRWCCQ